MNYKFTNAFGWVKEGHGRQASFFTPELSSHLFVLGWFFLGYLARAKPEDTAET